MPTVTTKGTDATTEQTVSALQAQLGDKYQVSANDHPNREVLSVKQLTPPSPRCTSSGKVASPNTMCTAVAS
jgi:hypothetical protein